MSLFKIQTKHVKAAAIASSVAFLCAAAIYFSPVELDHKIAIALSILTLSSLWLCPLPITFAMAFSAIGDYFGSCGNFIGQMGFFALAHVAFIYFFADRYFKKVEPDFKLTSKAKGFLGLMLICAALILYVAFSRIVPEAPAGIVRIGVGIYACIICTMMISAMLQRSSLYALGALLFVFSDFTLAWNKFVDPIEHSRYFVIVPYYLAQWLLYIRSTSFRVGPEMRLMRF